MERASLVIRSEHLVAEISHHRAELIRLQDGDGKDLLWNGCEKWWTGRAPLKSRAVNFDVQGQPSIQVRFANMPHLGVWTKPGAGFLCIETLAGLCGSLGICR
jgi:galactose mutarotase-like enzyme